MIIGGVSVTLLLFFILSWFIEDK